MTVGEEISGCSDDNNHQKRMKEAEGSSEKQEEKGITDNLESNVNALKRKYEGEGGEEEQAERSPTVSIIMPVHNAQDYLAEAFESIAAQSYRPLELVCFNDCSTDNSWEVMQSWQEKLQKANVSCLFLSSSCESAGGPGYGRNQSIQNSSGDYICHLDADDLMHSERIQLQYERCRDMNHTTAPTLLGCNFVRYPSNSTPYYTEWLNKLSQTEMMLQQYRECTIICPSWFYHRSIYDRVRDLNGMGFIEKDPALGRVPEDLIFFLDHLLLDGRLEKVERPLVTYRYVNTSWSIGTKALDLQRVRVKYIQTKVLSKWSSFSIYGGGHDAKKFINLLSHENAGKVQMFGDIAPKRIGTKYFHQGIRKHIPIVHWKELQKPLIICVASKRAGAELEENIQSLNLVEGVDFYRFN